MKASEAGAPASLPEAPRSSASKVAVAPFSAEGLTCLLALAVLMLATRPYAGIEHDGHLYAVQALRALDDTGLGQDLVFRFGNQDQFSIFGRGYAAAISLFGLSGATMVLWAAALVLWLGALVVLARSVFGATRMGYVAAGFVLALAPGYGNLMLSYGEPFVTPRPFAEASAMLALALFMRRRLAGGIVALGVAGAIHPLTGAAAILLGGWIVVGNWRSCLGAALIAAIGALVFAALGLGPFQWLFERLDPEWYRLTRLRDSIVYPSGWNGSLVFSGLMLPVTVASIVLSVGAPSLRRLALGLLGIAFAMLVISVVGADLLRNRLIAGSQLWRFLLFLSLFGNLLAIEALAADPAAHARSLRFLRLALVFAIIETALGQVGLMSGLVALGALLAFLFERAGQGRLRGWQRIVSLLPVAAGAPLSVAMIVTKLAQQEDGYALALTVFRLAMILAAMGYLLMPAGRTGRAGVLGLVLGLVVLGVVSDDRTAMQRAEVQAGPLDAEAEALMQNKAVYWEEGVGILWYKLRMPSYYSCRQKSGIQFFRGQAFEFERRAQALRGLNSGDFTPQLLGRCPEKVDPSEEGPLRQDQIAEACAQAGDLDVLVLRNAVPGARNLSFDIALPGRRGSDSEAVTYHLYLCDEPGRSDVATRDK